MTELDSKNNIETEFFIGKLKMCPKMDKNVQTETSPNGQKKGER